MTLTPQEEVRLYQGLLEHPGWRFLEAEMRDYVYRMVGNLDPNVLVGIRRALDYPKYRVNMLTAKASESSRA